MGVQIPLHARQRLRGLAGGGADARHDAHTLRLDEYPALFTYLAPDGRTEGIVGAAEPLTVPAGIQDRLLHGGNGALGIVCLGIQTQMTADIRPDAAVFHEHTGDKHAFRHRPLTGSGGLKALAGMGGEAVEVQTVVPVGAADQRQTVGPQVVDGIAEAAPQVLQQRLLRAGFRVEGHRLVQNGPVARLAEVGVRSGNEPQRVVVKAAAHSQVALLGQGLVLVIGAAVGELGGGNVQDAFPCPLEDHVDEAQQVLTGVTEAHAPAHTAFEVAGGTAHVEGDHALVLVPDVYHAVQLLVTGGHLIAVQQPAPMVPQGGKRPVKGCVGAVALHHGVGLFLVDDAGSAPFGVLRIFNVAQAQQQGLGCAGGQRQRELHGAYRRPAVSHAAGAGTVFHRLGHGRRAIHAYKGVAAGVKALVRAVCPQHGVVIPALAVLGLVIDGVGLQLHLANGEIALKIGAVVHGVPQAELRIGKQRHCAGRITLVGDGQPGQQAVVALGHQHFLTDGYAVFGAAEDRIAQSVAALILVQLRLRGLPAGVPDGVAVLDVYMKAVAVQRAVVIAVAGQTAETGIPVEGVTAGCVGHQRKKVLAAQVIDPRQRCAGCLDHIFAFCVVEVAKAHKNVSFRSRRGAGADITKTIKAYMDMRSIERVAHFCVKSKLFFSQFHKK